MDTNNNVHNRIRLWDLGVDSTTRRYLDCYFAINPLVALTGGNSGDQFVIHNPIHIPGVTPESHPIIIPGSDVITQIVLDPRQVEAFVVTSQLIPRQQKVWRHNIATGDTTELLASSSPFRIATSRHGELFVYGDGSVRKYGFAGLNMVLLQEAEAPDVLRALSYDDARDELVGLSDEHLIRFPRNLASDPITALLPGAVEADGSVSIAIDEEQQKYYICGSANPTIFVVGLIPETPRLRVESSLLLPAVQTPEDLQFTDEGTLLLINNGTIGEFGRTAAAGWQPRQDSALAGLPAARALVVGRSRSNFIPGVHDTPAWRNVTLNEGLVDVPDCDADFNQDGQLNSQDFFDFLVAFFNSDPAADFNANTVVNSQDFFDFLTAFFTGCN